MVKYSKRCRLLQALSIMISLVLIWEAIVGNTIDLEHLMNPCGLLNYIAKAGYYVPLTAMFVASSVVFSALGYIIGRRKLNVACSDGDKEYICAEIRKVFSGDDESVYNALRAISVKVPEVYMISQIANNDHKVYLVLGSRESIEKKYVEGVFNAICPHVKLEWIGYPRVKFVPIPRSISAVRPLRSYAVPRQCLGSEEYSVEVLTSPTVRVSGEVVIGVAVNTRSKEAVAIGLEDVFKHIGIFGSTGSGKTTTAAVVASQLPSKGVGVVVLDWHGEYVSLLRRMQGEFRLKELRLGLVNHDVLFNPFNHLHDEFGIEVLTDVMSYGLELTPAQAYILRRILEEEQPGSIEELIKGLQNYSPESAWQTESKHALLRKVCPLRMVSHLLGGSEDTLEADEREILVVPISKVPSITAKRMLSLLILASEFVARKRAKVQGRRQVYIIEEAHNVVPRSTEQSNIVCDMIAEVRKYGVGLMIISQAPSLMPTQVLANLNTMIVHSLKCSRDIEVIELSARLSKKYADVLPKLETGTALLISQAIAEPILVKVNPVFCGVRGSGPSNCEQEAIEKDQRSL